MEEEASLPHTFFIFLDVDFDPDLDAGPGFLISRSPVPIFCPTFSPLPSAAGVFAAAEADLVVAKLPSVPLVGAAAAGPGL